ncbi:MAG: LuxR C-terminal-related transcriptional regulator [Iamia sp.]
MGNGAVARGWPLLGRDEELHLLDVEAATRPVVVAGPPGVGKSRLVADWSASLTGEVVHAIATRASASVPFGAFAPWVPAGLAAADDRLGTLRALADHLLERSPRAVVVDDAHQLDEGSAALVLHLARHAQAPVVATVRSGTECPDPITALWKDGIGTRIDLRPLSERETTTLLSLRLGGRVHAATEQRLWKVSAGNPMYLREVTEAAVEQGLLAERDGAWCLSDTPAGTPRLVDLVEARIGRISEVDRAALELVALGEPLPSAVVGDLVPARRLARLAAAGLLTMTNRGDVEVVGLCHPLYGEVLRSTTSPLVAREHHRALAGAMVARGEEHADPLRVAQWMGEGEDPPSAELLVAASTRAMVLQDYGLATRLAAAAADAGGGVDAVLAQIRALRLDGHPAALVPLLAEADRRVTAPSERAAVAEVRAMGAFWQDQDGVTWATVVDEALDQLPPGNRGPVAITGASLGVMALDLGRAARLVDQVVDDTDRGTVLNALTLEGWVATLQGRPSALLSGFDERLPEVLDRMADDPLLAAFAATGYALAMELVGRREEAERLLLPLVAGDLGSRVSDELLYLALPTLLVGQLALAGGQVRSAATRARRALELMGEDRPYVYGRPVVAAGIASAASAQAGDPAAAAEVLDRIEGRDDVWVPEARVALDRGRAWTSAARGELGAARALATATAEGLAGTGAHGLEVLVLLDAVRFGAAADVAPRLEELEHCVEGPIVVATTQLARGLDDGDGHGLDAASSALEDLGLLLPAAEAATQAAGAHSVAGLARAAAAARRRAGELLAGCEGASTPLLAGAADHDVARLLTDREREVALMVAAGRSNREVAGALGVSLRTVNSHLNHAYVKLGTSDRSELARLIAPPVAAGGPSPGG